MGRPIRRSLHAGRDNPKDDAYRDGRRDEPENHLEDRQAQRLHHPAASRAGMSLLGNEAAAVRAERHSSGRTGRVDAAVYRGHLGRQSKAESVPRRPISRLLRPTHGRRTIAHSAYGFGSLPGRSINGTFRHASRKRLQSCATGPACRHKRRNFEAPYSSHLQEDAALRVVGRICR